MSTEPTVYTRKNPFPARLATNRLLTGEGSDKETRHLEISLQDSGLEYEVGDSMGIFCKNDPELVEEILKALDFSGDEIVPDGNKEPSPIRKALSETYIITQPDKKFLQAIVERAVAAPLLEELMDPERKSDLESYLWGMEIIDFLLEHPSVKFTPEEFVGTLRKLLPRLYSISSSLKAYPGQVHFTIAAVKYETHGRQRKGVCSTWLSERVGENDPVPLFVHTAKGFRLPEDLSTPVIMVGPGTGVAPFRAFLQEREATGATGKNWLFFGEQYAESNFFYQEELEKLQESGVLTNLSTAFSRDQASKIYVQHRLAENGPEVWKWLEEGAHFFVCGDAARMAKDVDVALHNIIANEGGLGDEGAALYLETMKKDKRYKRDVY